MTNQFEIDIRAKDSASPVFSRVGQNAKRMARDVQKGGSDASNSSLTAQLKAAAARRAEEREAKRAPTTGAMGRARGFARGFDGFSRSAGLVPDGMPGASSFMGTGAGIVGGVTMAGMATALMMAKWASSGANTLRASRGFGLNPDHMQELEGAAKVGGYDSEAMRRTMTGIAGSIHTAKWGMNPEAATLLSKYGFGRDVTPEAFSDRLPAIMGKLDAGQRRSFSAAFGIDPDSAGFFSRGQDFVDQRRGKAHSYGLVQSRQDLERAELGEEIKGKISSGATGLMNAVSSAIAGGVDRAVNGPGAAAPDAGLPTPATSGGVIRRIASGRVGVEHADGTVTPGAPSGDGRKTPEERLQDDRAALQRELSDPRHRLLPGQRDVLQQELMKVEVQINGLPHGVTATATATRGGARIGTTNPASR